MRIEEVGDKTFIYMIKDALSKEECEKIINLYDNNEEYQLEGITGGGLNLDLKKTKDINLPNMIRRHHLESMNIDNILFSSLNKGLKALKEAIGNSNISMLMKAENWFAHDDGYLIQVYSKDGYYHWHNDENMTYNGVHRQVTALWYLNDVPEENGGATEFLKQGVSITPTAGTLIFFPSFWTHIHRACELLDGKKYIATTWVGIDRSGT